MTHPGIARKARRTKRFAEQVDRRWNLKFFRKSRTERAAQERVARVLLSEIAAGTWGGDS